MPSSSDPCPECGTPVSAGGSHGGLCPQCLLAAGWGDDVETIPFSSGGIPGAPAASRTKELLSETIGPYRLLELLGEGGMGRVYAAEQSTPIHRKVAIKLLKPGMDSREILIRFESERQALALMNHPWIARVYEAGATSGGRPYFVMELVDGSPITDFCDRHKLPIPRRLDLFVKVCEAVNHAHQKGVIHRDLKPSNILVELVDGIPSPKIIDFGLAKAMNQELTIRSVATQMGDLMGTPQYMSPEQALGIVSEIDTRSDVYSLGVILYELLAGEAPISREEIRKAGILGMAKLLEEKEPERPSARLKFLQDTAIPVAENRNTDPTGLDRQLRGELDWVALKCLEKEKSRRYESVSSLAGDIERHLKDEVVSAKPPSVSYRFQKAVKRNRTAFAAALAVFLAILVGSGVAVWQAIEAKMAQRKTAESLARETKANRRLQARLLDLVGLERVSQSVVHNDPDRSIAKYSEGAVHPRAGIQSAVFPGPDRLVIACGSELRFFELMRMQEVGRFQLEEPVIALFSIGSDEQFVAVTRGIGQIRKTKIYLVPTEEGGFIECLFECTDVKALAAPVAFARSDRRGEILMAFGFSSSGHLGFEAGLPGNPDESPDGLFLEEAKSIAVLQFDIHSRKIALAGTAENFGQGEWNHVRGEVSSRFPTFHWPNADVDGEACDGILEKAALEQKSGWMPLAHWEDKIVLVAPERKIPDGGREEVLQDEIPIKDLRIYDARTAKLTGLPTGLASLSALDLGERVTDERVCDLPSLDHLSPATLAKLESSHRVYLAEVTPDRQIALKYRGLDGIETAEDRETFLQSLHLRMILEVAPDRTVSVEAGPGEPRREHSLGAPGESLHVGLDGEVIFYVGRFRDFEGVLVYDGHTGKVLYRITSGDLGLSGADSIGTAFMEKNDGLLVATQRGLLRVRKNAEGEWTHSIENHPIK
jgi:serine/threonine protein kinase